MKSIRDIAHQLRVNGHAVFLCARNPAVPWPARCFGMAIAAYALSPIDLIPDFVPVLGLLDDAILVPIGIWLFLKMVPVPVFEAAKAEAEAASQRPISRSGAAIIILIWLAAGLWLGTLLWSAHFY